VIQTSGESAAGHHAPAGGIFLPRTVELSVIGLDPFTLAGFVGAAMLIVTYFANQQGWLTDDNWRFPAGNLIGSLLILLSLITAWNLPSVVIEVFWSAISVYGLCRRLRRPRRDAP
jgi:hypothetical protein